MSFVGFGGTRCIVRALLTKAYKTLHSARPREAVMATTGETTSPEQQSHQGRDPHGLTPMERKFVEAIYGPAKGNATKAAELAGYKADASRGALRVSASRLLHRPRVRRAMQDADKKRMAEWAAQSAARGRRPW